MKKSVFAVLCALAAFLCFSGCSNDLSRNENSKYGTVSVNGTDGRAVYVDGIKKAIVTVKGYDSNGNVFERSSSLVSVSSGTASGISVTDIPVTKNAVVTVESYGDANGKNKISGIKLSAVHDIVAGNNSISVTWETTKEGNVYSALLDAGVNTNTLTDEQVSSINNLVSSFSSYDVSLIDYDSIAENFADFGSFSSASSYALESATLSLTTTDISGYTLQVGDPSSAIKTVSSASETVTISDIAPGTWTLYAIDGDKNVKTSKSITVKSGKSYSGSVVKKSATSITDKIVLHYSTTNASWKNIWVYNDNNNSINYCTNKTWPGDSLTDKDGDGYYDVEVSTTDSICVIFASADGKSQSNTYKISSGAGEYLFNGSSFETFESSTDETVTITIGTNDDSDDDDDDNTDDGTYTVHVYNSSWAGTHYLYAYTGSTAITSTWPGNAMTAESTSGSYKISVSLDLSTASLIFNNNSSQYPGSGEAGVSFPSGVSEAWFNLSDYSWTTSDPSDSEAPTISWNSTLSGTVSGTQTISVTASDDKKLARVDLYMDSTLIGTITSFTSSGVGTYSWDTTTAKNGSHSLYAVAYDGAENSAKTSEVSVTVSNSGISPTAVITNPGYIYANTEKTFSAADSYDSNGEIVSYSWNFGDGETVTGVSATHTYSTSGSYTITLTVTDDENLTGTATYKVSVVDKGSFTHRDFREETVYFMMTDRFADGDSTNNNIWGDEYVGDSDVYTYDESKTGKLSYYHGGDFKGIIKYLDYIADMGFTAIWITPVVKQVEGRYYYGGEYEASPFHGYWAYDFDKIDPHLHSKGKDSDGWDDYKALIDACHAKGIRVMQDIVCNHGHPTAANTSTKWYDERNTIIMDGKTWTWGEDGDPYYDSSDKYQGFFDYWGGPTCAGLIDFNESGDDGKDARQHLINVYKKFIDAGVDAFRIDTVAYMTADWWGEFADTMYTYAQSLGNDYFYMVGEAWGGRGASIYLHSKDTKGPTASGAFHQLDMTASCMDYPGQMCTTFMDGGNYGQFVSMTSSDESQGLTDEDSTWSGMFVDNHDVYRANGQLNQTQYINALNYIYLFRGVPIVYYGTEALYSWSGAAQTTNKEDVCARWMLGDKGIAYVQENQPALYKQLKILNQVRHESECVQKGIQANIDVSGDKAAITRTYNGKTAYIVLSKGSATQSQSFDVTSGNYTLYTCSDQTLTTSSASYSGSVTLTSPANGFVVLSPED